MTLVHLVVEETKCLDSQVFIYARGPTSFGLTEFRNTNMQRSNVINYQKAGFTIFHFENCTFNDIDWFGLYLLDVLQVRIINSEFRVRDM